MPTGKIKFINREKKFGFIATQDGGELHFKLQVVRKPTRWEDLQQGMQVEFEVTQGDKGPTARWVARAGVGAKSTQPHQPAQQQARTQTVVMTFANGYRFLNPYNFVRFLSPAGAVKGAGNALGPIGEKLLARGVKGGIQTAGSETAQQLLDQCPPPPHDRYVGLTGKITCTLTTETPLFISDAEGVVMKVLNDGKEHKIFRSFQTEAEKYRYLIPASGLRGMIRNVFEVATNSCMAVFDGSRQSKHAETGEGRTLVPAIVDDVSGDDWTIKVLTGTTTYDPNGPKSDRINPLYAAWLKSYYPIKNSKTAAQKPNSPYAQRPFVKIPKGLKHGSPCAATLELMEHPERDLGHGKKMQPFWFWNVMEVAAAREDLKLEENGDRIKADGWLYLTNQNTENKHDERFFFVSDEKREEQVSARLDKTVRTRYNDLIRDYHKRHAEAIAKRKTPAIPEKTSSNPKDPKEPAYSRFIVEEYRDLGKGDLVYAKIEKDEKGKWRTAYIVPASLPRVAYDRTIFELLHDDNQNLETCSKHDHLCPACRTFGWVHRPTENDASKRGKEIAYAGRLRFSHGRLQDKAKTIDHEIPLAILSSPKPTTTSFYLLDQHGKPDFNATYDTSGAKLRGRKFYRHHGNKLNAQEYTRPNGKQDGQNRTVKEVLDRNNKFTFTIDFTNLAAIELGALLWALEMKYQDAGGQEQQLFHRLGFAKPLGFGSVTINIDQLEVFSPQKRYGSLDQRGWRPITRGDWNEKYIAPFQAAMAARYGKEFYSLENIQDLKALLSEPKQCDRIHYPRPPYKEAPDRDATKPDPAGKQFEWFVGNKKRNAKKFHFNAFPLPLAVEDTQGFELIDGDGNIYSGN